jgi:phage terminase large subunit
VTYTVRERSPTGASLRGGALDLWRYQGHAAVLAGPAETGKTYACCLKLNALLWLFPRSQAVVVRKVRNTMVGSVLATYKTVLGPDSPVRPHGGESPAWYDYPNGSRLWVAGLDDPQKVLSSERDFVLINQAEELTLDDFEVLLTRATGRAANAPYPQVFGDANPGPPQHWIRQRAGLKVFESRHEDNPSLWDGSKWTERGVRTLAVLDALTGVRKERLRYGRWVAAEGTVYQFDPSAHLVPPSHVPAARWCVVGVDWGLRNPGALQVWQVDGDGRMYLVHELYRTGKLIDWWVERALEVKAKYRPEAFVCDPSEPAYIEAFTRAGCYAVGAENDVEPGIQSVQARLAVQPDGRPRLMIVEGCLKDRDEDLAAARKPVCLRDELDLYVYPKGADGRPAKEVPVKEHDHACDACRYASVFVDARVRGAGTIGTSGRKSPFAGAGFRGGRFGGKPAGGW